jgi:hypothetical protein
MASKRELKEYLKKQLLEGVPREDLREALIEAGEDPSILDEVEIDEEVEQMLREIIIRRMRRAQMPETPKPREPPFLVKIFRAEFKVLGFFSLGVAMLAGLNGFMLDYFSKNATAMGTAIGMIVLFLGLGMLMLKLARDLPTRKKNAWLVSIGLFGIIAVADVLSMLLITIHPLTIVELFWSAGNLAGLVAVAGFFFEEEY